VAFVIMLFTGLAGYLGTGVATSNSIYNWLFNNVYTPLGSTTYAITGFYIFSAAYRAFRARNVDAALMLIAGCFVILSNAPVGEVIWSGIPAIGMVQVRRPGARNEGLRSGRRPRNDRLRLQGPAG
jgi:hypothetical protein